MAIQLDSRDPRDPRHVRRCRVVVWSVLVALTATLASLLPTAGALTVAAHARISPIALSAARAASTRAQGTSTATRFAPVCASATSTGVAHCHAIKQVLDTASSSGGGGPTGYTPADLLAAYALPSAPVGAGRVVAIIDAYDDPNAEADLAVYRTTFGLSPCTTANGCFRKVNAHGGTNYPKSDVAWAAEMSLDLDMVSAICSACRILLVEAGNANLTSLGVAVNTAVALGADAVSNSYGTPELGNEIRYDRAYFDHPGVAITASAGDAGYGTQYPAASPFVTAVGGTTLTRASTSARGWSETAWNNTGSGCSTYEAQPAWQTSVQSLAGACGMRALADVAAVADPQTGVAVYDSFAVSGQTGGWAVYGGTSVGAPVIAAVYALAGTSHTGSGNATGIPYTHTISFYDVTAGSNSSTCSALVLCQAQVGWDGPTGLGTPAGTAGFISA